MVLKGPVIVDEESRIQLLIRGVVDFDCAVWQKHQVRLQLAILVDVAYSIRDVLVDRGVVLN